MKLIVILFLMTFSAIAFSQNEWWRIGKNAETEKQTEEVTKKEKPQQLEKPEEVTPETKEKDNWIKDSIVEPENIKQETSTNLDLSFRRFNGDFGYTVNFFYNDIKNFYFQENTGLVFDEVDGLESADEAHSDAIAVYQFTRKDVELYGFEFDVHYQINSNAMVKVFGDSTRAKLKNNEGNLPRIPANKLGSELLYDLGRLQLTLTGTHYFDQNDISIFETKTDGYTLFDAQVNYQLDLGPIDTQLYLNVDNISDELGFVHTSFIKDTAPLPGRNFRFGIRGYF
jgi:iron complex outermembrane receptor protein